MFSLYLYAGRVHIENIKIFKRQATMEKYFCQLILVLGLTGFAFPVSKSYAIHFCFCHSVKFCAFIDNGGSQPNYFVAFGLSLIKNTGIRPGVYLI